MHHLFFAPELEETSRTIILSESEARHAVKVLRLDDGAGIYLTNGKGLLASGVISIPNKRQVVVNIQNITVKDKPKPEIILAMALIKPARFEIAVEKVTELGISAILPLESRYVVHHQFRRRRLEEIIISAMKQSLQVHKPVLYDPLSVEGLEEFISGNNVTHCIYFDREGEETMDTDIEPDAKIMYFIGPEGGFTSEEEDRIKALGASQISLADNRLRTETAAIAGLIKIKSLAIKS